MPARWPDPARMIAGITSPRRAQCSARYEATQRIRFMAGNDAMHCSRYRQLRFFVLAVDKYACTF